ncbi:MAG: hypothetical protein JWQ11_609 [Rhizobacter sp.]|nr:hypothetical protein [Rhizobacter sp.]
MQLTTLPAQITKTLVLQAPSFDSLVEQIQFARNQHAIQMRESKNQGPHQAAEQECNELLRQLQSARATVAVDVGEALVDDEICDAGCVPFGH